MFTNVGRKIKGLAKFVCYVGIVLSVASGAMMIYASTQMYYGEGMLAGGIATIIVGPILAWLSSLTLYGYGHLIDRTQNIDTRLERIEKRLPSTMMQSYAEKNQ